jgi:nucleotide-binding universal stress UspA family protein
MYERIVVGAAETETARRAVEHAGDLARLTGAELHLVLAFDPYWDRIEPTSTPATVRARGYLETLVSDLELDATVHPVAGDADTAILQTAEQVGADLIVVGSKGMRGTGRLLGSVPNSVAHHASCSVLIVSTD